MALGPVGIMSEFFKAPEQARQEGQDRQRLAGAREISAKSAFRGSGPGGRTSGSQGGEGGPGPSALARISGAAVQRTKRRLFAFKRSSADIPVLITRLAPESIAAEAYRTVRTNLEFIRTDRPCRNLVVTSPTAGSGKSTTAANLAVAIAQSGVRVCLVDADTRRPVIHEIFGFANTGGLTTALKEGESLAAVARATDVENLSVVVSGPNPSGSAQAFFTSLRLQKVMTDGPNHFDLIIYDTPPVLLVADSVNVAALGDGVIVVVRWGSIPPSVLERAVQQIRQVNGRILGVLLNRVNLRRHDDDVYRYYRAYYGQK